MQAFSPHKDFNTTSKLLYQTKVTKLTPWSYFLRANFLQLMLYYLRCLLGKLTHSPTKTIVSGEWPCLELRLLFFSPVKSLPVSIT